MGKEMRDLVDWARGRKVVVSLLVALTLVVGMLIGTVISGRVTAAREQGNGAAATPLAIPEPVQLSSTFAAIASKLEPAVVNISTTQVMERSRSRATPRRPAPQDPFQDFFDRFFDFPDQGPEAARSLGSGVIVDKRGYILTNNHVVEQATKVQVKLQDDPTLYTAKVIGTDTETDLAVIKIESKGELATAKLGNSDAVRVGDWVLAFGSPFGLEATVTAGIVSAKDRSNVGQQFQRFIQTDAAINRGNSGGPLVNMAGEVIGLNSAIYTGTGSFAGVGFALPSNTAIRVYNQLVQHGKVVRGSIGIRFNEENSRNPVLLQELGVTSGMVIQDVEPGSPAERAGLQPGDVITSVNGHPVKTGSDLVDPIAESPIGAKVQLGYTRDRKANETTVTVEDRTKVFSELAGRDSERPNEAAPAELGMRVETLTPELARRLGVETSAGMIVTEVEPAGFAEDIGVLRGDVIAEVNREPVRSVADYRRLVGQLKPGQNVVFRILRRSGTPGGESRMLTVHVAGVVPNPE